MEVKYRNKKIEKICKNAAYAQRTLSGRMVELIHQRIDEISAASSVEEMMRYHIGRCHSLTNNRKGQYAVDLEHPYRLIFTIEGEWVEIARIQEIVDYH